MGLEEYLHKTGEKLVACVPCTLSNGYRPEIDVSQELAGAQAFYLYSLIGVLRWILELGRGNICVEVLMTPLHLALPQAGNIQEVYQMFSYLKKHHNAEMVSDPTPLDFYRSYF